MADDDRPKEFGERLTDWERNFDKTANEMMGTEAFSAWINLFQQSQLTAQRTFSSFVTQQREAMNAPTRDDVIRVGESVRRLEQRMEAIEAMLRAALPAVERGPDRPRPTRNRQPPVELMNRSTDEGDKA